MWRRLWSSGSGVFNRSLTAPIGTKAQPFCPIPPPSSSALSFYYSGSRRGGGRATAVSTPWSHITSFSFSSSNNTSDDKNSSANNDNNHIVITCAEARRLMRLVNVEALKMKLGMEAKEIIPYSDLLEACQAMGIARSLDEAVAFARVLDDAGVVLLFRDKVYLHPDKVVDLIRRAVPLALTPDDDPEKDELKILQEKKEEIDVLAHKQVRRILWCGLCFGLTLVGLFFRLTFWEFSWDVMEPIAFFATTSGIVIGYAYFLMTARDPTYQDLMKRLFLARQRKLFKKLNFDVERFKELQTKLKSPLDATTSIRKRVGVELDLDDAIHN